jgi:hypothetical protein
MAHSYPPMMMQHRYYPGNFPLIYRTDGTGYLLYDGKAYMHIDNSNHIFQDGELMYAPNGYLYKYDLRTNNFHHIQEHKPYYLQEQNYYPGNFPLIYGQDGTAYSLNNRRAYIYEDMNNHNHKFKDGELMYEKDGYLYRYNLRNRNFINLRRHSSYQLYYPPQQPHQPQEPPKPEQPPHRLSAYNRANKEILERIRDLSPFDVQNNNVSSHPISLAIATKAATLANGTIRPTFIGSPRIWEYIKTNQPHMSYDEYISKDLHLNSSTDKSAFILDNEHAFVFDSKNDEILKIRNDTENFNFKFYFSKEGRGDIPEKSIFKRDDSIKILRTAIRKNTYIHFKDYNQTIVIIDNNTNFEFPKSYEEFRKPKAPNLQSFFELIKEPDGVGADKKKMNLLIDAENIIMIDHKWRINTETSLNALIPHGLVNKIISFVNIIDKGKNKYNKYICIISRFRLQQYYEQYYEQLKLNGRDAKDLIDKLNNVDNTDLLIIEKTIPELNITIYFISLPFQKAAIMESARMNDFNKSAKSALVAERLGPAFKEDGSESDDLLLIYFFFRCGGNILSFDKFKWLKAGRIKTSTDEVYSFINAGDYFTDFYALKVNPGEPQLITNFQTDIEEDIDKLKTNKPDSILELSSNPLPLDPSSDPELLHSIIEKNLTPFQKKKRQKARTSIASASAASNNPPSQDGGSKKRKTIKKTIHKRKNKKVSQSQNNKKKLTCKMRK